MPTARQKVFVYIKKHRAVSAMELARDLRMTRANARHHLSLLSKNGQIELVGQRSAGSKGGRPIKIYGISRNILGDGLPTLSHHLLNEWLGSLDEVDKKNGLETLGKCLVDSSEFAMSVSPMARLTETVRHLNKLGYQSRWEAHASGPRIILGHCPYAAIITEHTELCEMDAALLAECLGERVTQIAKLAGKDEGRPYCVFGL